MNNISPGTILIVDDNISNLQLIVTMLSKYEYEILVARSGPEAIKIANESPVDLILLDILMPKMDGFEVCSVLKSSEKTKELPVIFLSALDDVNSKIQGFSLGGVDYISKPFYEEEVMARVRTHLSLERTKQELQQTITNLRISESARRKSEEHLQTILNSIPQQIAYLDEKLDFQFVNYNWETLSKHPSKDRIGKNFRDIITKDYFEEVLPLFERALSGEHIQQEKIIPLAEGVENIFDIQIIPDQDEKGYIRGIFVVLTDITHHKQNENVIRNLQKQMEVILNSIQSVIYVTDMDDCRILYANQECINVYGDVIEKVLSPALEEELGIPYSCCPAENLISRDGTPTGTYTWEYENAKTGRWYLCHDIAIPWIDGRIVRMEIATDLTEKRMNEVALKQSNQKLNLLSSITRHDIINKLTISKGYLALLTDDSLTPMQEKLIDGITRSMNDIDQFIVFTRTYQEIGLKAPEWQDVRNVCNQAITGVQAEKITIHNEINGVLILVDPLFEKVCYNLIENAIRHGKHLTTITIAAGEREDGLVISISDDGIGVLDGEKELIFERGFGKNTGFGLFLVREILSISGITISECGQYNSGCRFEIRVPKRGYSFSSHPKEQ